MRRARLERGKLHGKRRGFAPPVDFVLRKRRKVQERHAPGQRFLRERHHMKRLRSRQPIIARLRTIVHGDFQIGKQLGRILDLVNEDGRLVQAQKRRRLSPCQPPLLKIIKRHIRALRREVTQQRRLPHLPRPRNEQARIFLRQLQNPVIQIAIDKSHHHRPQQKFRLKWNATPF